MNSMYKVYKSLSSRSEEDMVAYNETENTININKFSLCASEIDGDILINFIFESQYFLLPIRSFDSLYSFISGILDDKITFRRSSQRVIDVIGWSQKKNDVKYASVLKAKRIASGIFGFSLLGAALFLIISFISYIITPKNVFNTSDASLLILIASIIIAAVNAIRYTCSSDYELLPNPLQFCGGTLLCGFGVSMLVLTVIGKELSDNNTFGGIFAFSLFIVFGILLILLACFKKFNSVSYESNILKLIRIPELPANDEIKAIIKKMRKIIRRESVLVIEDDSITPLITDSKFGGVPYWDISMPYPCNSKNIPMLFLAQFDLGQLPENSFLPKSGMLQFFVWHDSESDFQSECKVVYHPEINYFADADSVEEYIEKSAENGHTPHFLDEVGIRFEKKSIMPDANSIESDKAMHAAAKELGIHLDDSLTAKDLLDDNECSEIQDSLYKTALLGYPYFDISSPDDEETCHYDSLLFQIAYNDYNNKDSVIFKSTEGFFINSDDLKNQNFDDVYYSWNCH